METTSDSSERLKQIVISLQKSLECPVCVDTLQVPFKLCARGHGICNNCIENLKDCPICHGAFTLENPACVKNILEEMPRLCHNSYYGCTEVIDRGYIDGKLEIHERFCGFRPTYCKVSNCKAVLSACKLRKHLNEQHSHRFTAKTPHAPMVFPEFDVRVAYNDAIPVDIAGNFFWITYSSDKDKKQLAFNFQWIPIGLPKENFYVNIDIKAGQFQYVHTLKASVLSDYEEVIDEHECGLKGYDLQRICSWSNNNTLKEQSVMKVPQSDLKHFIENRNLHFDLKFFQKNFD